jgi:ABC-type transport system involved in multi-copper enzyme maturation permease subunit
VIRFAWVQARIQTLIVAAVLAVMAVALAITGPHLVHLYNTTVAGCSARGNCPAAISQYLNNDSTLRTWLGVVVVAGPGILGVFWGAPMVARELEAGTFRLAWTQSVTRTRWLVMKLGLVGLASMTAAGLASLIVTWWASPLDRAHMNVFNTFDERDIVPIGFVLFAFVVGVLAGLIIRRALPAMAATLVAFVGARLAVTKWARPNLISPLHHSDSITAASIVGYGSTSGPGAASTLQLAPPNMPNAWVYSTRLVDSSGHRLTAAYLNTACPAVVNGGRGGGGLPGGLGIGSASNHVQTPASAQDALQQCGAKVASVFHEVITYQPGSRYWDFQWIELAIYFAAALTLAGICVWWVRRRLP